MEEGEREQTSWNTSVLPAVCGEEMRESGRLKMVPLARISGGRRAVGEPRWAPPRETPLGRFFWGVIDA